MNTNKENISWKKKKIIDSITPFTLLDFKDQTSAIIWFSGCNMRCSFCYNPEIVLGNASLCFEDIIEFLDSRKNLLKGIVLCGGEPTIHKELYPLCIELKKMGYKIKLDTNGLNPTLVAQLTNNNLIDFIALDFKGINENFKTITHVDKFDQFQNTLQFLIENDFDFEVRTTYHQDLISLNELYIMLDFLESLRYDKKYYIQNFINTKPTLGYIQNKSTQDLSKIIQNNYLFEIEFRNFISIQNNQ